MRLVVFRRLLHSHPVVNQFFKRHHFKVDEEGLAQHYGLKTEVLDLTSSLDVALFFATCWYDHANDCYSYYDDGKEHEAILYVFNPILDNEPTPSFLQYLQSALAYTTGLPHLVIQKYESLTFHHLHNMQESLLH